MKHKKKERNSAQRINDPRYQPREVSDVDHSEMVEVGTRRYIHYLKALRILSSKLDTSPKEIVGWLLLGSEAYGLDGYRNPLTDPGMRFSIVGYSALDYLPAMMSCWFIEDDIVNFQPRERLITGECLISRWSKQPSVMPFAFIKMLVTSGQLYDFHPMGRTKWHGDYDDLYDGSKESAFFLMSQVKEIEKKYFFPDDSSYPFKQGTSRRGVTGKDIRRCFTFWSDKRWKTVLQKPGEWLKAARVGPVVSRKASFWNPAEVANCLWAYRLKNWNAPDKRLSEHARLIPSKGILEKILKENFPEFLEDWQPDLD